MTTATLTKLKRNKDRKVANLVTPNGERPAIANTFGLPAGRNFSCPNATATCSRVCYAGKLEKIFKATRENLIHNWNLLQGKSRVEMAVMLDEMITEFKQDCDERGAEKLFRIHWDGDFFSEDYTHAWWLVITQHTDVQFWVYTRVPSAIEILQGIDNLALYFSTDVDNKDIAERLLDMSPTGFKIAYLGTTFLEGKSEVKKLTGKVGAICPENSKRIPLISGSGSACVSCGLCIYGKADIRFSATKK